MLDHLIQLHWLGIFVSTLVYFFIGYLWYSPVLFAKSWIKLANIKMDDPEAKKGMGKMMIGSFLLMFLTCIGLGLLTMHLPNTSIAEAAKHGLLLGICFSSTAISIGYIYTCKPMGLYAIDCGYHLAGIIAANIVIYLMG